ncbi:MAG TPA: hypothetical protein VIG68_01050, partial [Lysobacter sp.]
MHEAGPRVVLLARPGGARERLLAALNQAGTQLVLDADPTRIEVAELQAAAPGFVVVVLDPLTEPVLERFDPVLQDPAVEVMFEEAEVAARREGWDAARWIRHIAAKLHGHADVLPPTTQAPSAAATGTLGAGTFDAGAPDSDAGRREDAAHPDGFADLDLELPAASPHPLSDEFVAGVEPGEYAGFDPVAAELADMEFSADRIVQLDFAAEPGSGAGVSGSAAPEPALPDLDFEFDGALVLPGHAARSDEAPGAGHRFDPSADTAAEAGGPAHEFNLDFEWEAAPPARAAAEGAPEQGLRF